MPEAVGVVGTGMLGAAVAERLLGRGHGVVAYNRTAEKAAALAGSGASVAGSPADVAARCPLVITCVRDAAAVREVALGPRGIAASGASPVVCDMSTITPADSRSIASDLRAAAGAEMLDTPVMGGPAVAARGELVMMASGDRASFDAHRGALGGVASSIFFLGGAGTALTVKLAMNLQIASLAMSISEGIAMVRAASVDPGDFLAVLNSTYFGTGMSRNKAYKMADGRYDPTFLLSNLRKDLRAVNEAAGSAGLRLPLAAMAEGAYDAAVEAGLGGLDYTGILEYVEGLRRRGAPPGGGGGGGGGGPEPAG